ncbi:MAG: STAS domain-containing protein [Solirubrobacteraceae bacterium]
MSYLSNREISSKLMSVGTNAGPLVPARALKQPPLEIEDFVQGSSHTLALAGELDLSTSSALHTTISELCSDGAEEIVLDLSELSFIDSTGLRTILDGMTLCQEQGCNFSVIPGQHQVQRVFALTGLLDLVPFRMASANSDGRPTTDVSSTG